MTNLKKIYTHIVNGFTDYEYNGKPIFFKHFNTFDQALVDDIYNESFSRAKSLGLKHESDKLEECSKSGTWPKSKEQSIKSLDREIESLFMAKKRLSYSGQLEEINKLINENMNKLTDLYNERSRVVGKTIEDYASQKSNIEFIYLSSFLDRELMTPIFQREVFDDMEMGQMADLIDTYKNAMADITNENIKKISVEPFFAKPLALLNNIADFFDVSVYKLTNYQIQLLDYGSYYKSIMEECYDAPQDVKKDPDKLEEFYLIKRNSENKKEDTNKNTEGKFRSAIKNKAKTIV